LEIAFQLFYRTETKPANDEISELNFESKIRKQDCRLVPLGYFVALTNLVSRNLDAVLGQARLFSLGQR
jgi:hypothetical protein